MGGVLKKDQYRAKKVLRSTKAWSHTRRAGSAVSNSLRDWLSPVAWWAHNKPAAVKHSKEMTKEHIMSETGIV
jgi:hypothetical protein